MSDSKDDVGRSLISAVNEGNVDSLKKLVESHGLSHCEGWYGGYALLRDIIKSGHLEMATFFLQADTKKSNKTNYADTLLHLAIEHKGEKLVHLLLKENAPIDARNGQNETPLHIAAKEGYADGVKVLLNKNASVTVQNNEGSTPLLLAIEGKHETVVQMLLEHASANLKDEIDHTPSTSPPGQRNSLLNRILLCNPCACDKVNKLVVRIVIYDEGPMKIVDDLTNQGFILSHEYVNESFLLAAIDKGKTELIEKILLITNAEGIGAKAYLSLLNTAVRSSYKEIVKLLLNARCPNSKDEEKNYTEEDKWVEVVQLLIVRDADVTEAPALLPLAVEKGFVEVSKLLIENGADVNALGTQGSTPLHLSCGWVLHGDKENRQDEILKFLLRNGADVNIRKYGFTAFHHAAFENRKEAVCFFLNFGVDVDLRAEHDATPLHAACQSLTTNPEIVEILLKNKANVDARKTTGETPLLIANCTKVVETLLKFGADIDARVPGNKNALHNALLIENYRVATVLLDNGCDFDVKCTREGTVLDIVLSKAERRREFYSYGIDAAHRYFPCDFIGWEIHGTVQIVKEHVMKLEAASLYVVRKSLRDTLSKFNCRECKMLSGFPQECQEEVNRMKNEHLNPQWTLYDIFVNTQNPIYTRDKSLTHNLNGFNFEKFPIYESLILGCLQRWESRLELLSSGQRTLDILIKTSNKLNGNKYSVLPVEILEQIVLHLRNIDLNNLIACGEARKRQLKRQSRC